jgi:peroxiredoxin
VLVVHLECSVEGTRLVADRQGFRFPMANDEALEMALPYSPTTTYLIDEQGRIAARWLDRIHDRATPEKILIAIDELDGR